MQRKLSLGFCSVAVLQIFQQFSYASPMRLLMQPLWSLLRLQCAPDVCPMILNASAMYTNVSPMMTKCGLNAASMRSQCEGRAPMCSSQLHGSSIAYHGDSMQFPCHFNLFHANSMPFPCHFKHSTSFRANSMPFHANGYRFHSNSMSVHANSMPFHA